MVLTKIGKLYNDHDNNSSENSSCFGESDQEVICSLNEEQVSVLLRLTPDCPFVLGSVYIDQLVGLGGWEQDLLDQMKDRVNDEKFDNPITLIKYLQKEIQKRRPALVLSSSDYNKKSHFIMVCPITSKIKNYPFEIVINQPKISGAILADQI